MKTNRSSAKLVAICGVDGVGKSSLIARLRERSALARTVYIRRDLSPARDLVRKYHRRVYNDPLELIHGSYAALTAMALSLDFLAYYERTVLPLMWDPEVDLIVADRHALCYAAYLACAAPQIDTAQLFAQVALPDLTVLVTADPALLPERYARRGGAAEDEQPALTRRFAEGYEQSIAAHSGRLLRLSNDSDLETAYDRLLSALQAVLRP